MLTVTVMSGCDSPGSGGGFACPDQGEELQVSDAQLAKKVVHRIGFGSIA